MACQSWLSAAKILYKLTKSKDFGTLMPANTSVRESADVNTKE